MSEGDATSGEAGGEGAGEGRAVFFVSDRTGITAETLGNTLLSQFEAVRFRRVTLPFVDSAERACAARERIDAEAERSGCRPLVFSTLVDPALRRVVASCRGVFLDFFDAFIQPVERELGMAYARAPGRMHGMADPARYAGRMDAVNFALATDDGAGVRHYGQADVILLGVSRCGKTPTSLYLALQFGVRAANYPLTADVLEGGVLPAALAPHRAALYGLTIAPERLAMLRAARHPDGGYAAISACRAEVRRAETLYREEAIAFLNTTAMSIEEIATTILQHRGLR